jgi:trans-aconitate methyltransferase
MAEQLPDWAPEGTDANTVSVARMYDYFLGGPHNFAVDRQVADQVIALVPEVQPIVRANRAFLHRAVRHLVDRGVRQFLDLGSGIPSIGNVHETAQQIAPETRVLYVDHDPVAVAHSEQILRHNPRAEVLMGDLRRPDEILAAADLLDLSEPVGVLLGSVLHFVPDSERPQEILGRLRERLAPGSYLAVTHVSDESRPEESAQILKLYESSANPVIPRTRAAVVELLAGWELIEPGAVWITEWRPDHPDDVGPDPAGSSMTAVLARKPLGRKP